MKRWFICYEYHLPNTAVSTRGNITIAGENPIQWQERINKQNPDRFMVILFFCEVPE